jgi:hypothetical protein
MPSNILTAEELRLELHVIKRINDFIVVRLDLSCVDEVGSATVLGSGRSRAGGENCAIGAASCDEALAMRSEGEMNIPSWRSSSPLSVAMIAV